MIAVTRSVMAPKNVKVPKDMVREVKKNLADVFIDVYDSHWICPCGSIVSTLDSIAVNQTLSLILNFFARGVNACASSPGRMEEPARGRDVGQQEDNASEP